MSIIVTESERAELLLKYKNLLDIGAVTEEEYNKKKEEILSNTVVSNDLHGGMDMETGTVENILVKHIEGDNIVVCPHCGKEQRKNSFGCIWCHKKF